MHAKSFFAMRKSRTAWPMTVQPARPWLVQPIGKAAGKRPSKKMNPVIADLLRKGSLKKQRSLMAPTAHKRDTAKGPRACGKPMMSSASASRVVPRTLPHLTRPFPP
jgi:hypothetical protein